MTDRIQDRSSGFPVHLAFGVVLLFIVALKYYLYFYSDLRGSGLTAGRLGATLGHLLIWSFAYSMCLLSRNRVRMGAVAAPTLFLGILTVPLLGYLGLIVMFIVYRAERGGDSDRRISVTA